MHLKKNRCITYDQIQCHSKLVETAEKKIYLKIRESGRNLNTCEDGPSAWRKLMLMWTQK